MRSYRAQLLGVEVEVLEFDEGVETVERASRASGAPPDAIVKTLLVKAGGEYVVVLARGNVRVDVEALSRALGAPASMAKAREVREVLGVEPGAVTPLSDRVKSLRVIADPGILAHEYLLAGGGATNKLIRVKTADLVNALSPTFLEVFR
jgi:prolyl-tRNA editing enzyme YbaK/EbsC (Cys-tRNA(Pro) deacylase)